MRLNTKTFRKQFCRNERRAVACHGERGEREAAELLMHGRAKYAVRERNAETEATLADFDGKSSRV